MVTGVQTCALPIYAAVVVDSITKEWLGAVGGVFEQRNNNDYELQQSQSGNADYGQRNRDNLYTGIGCTGMDVLTTENPSGPDVILRDRYNNPLIYKP